MKVTGFTIAGRRETKINQDTMYLIHICNMRCLQMCKPLFRSKFVLFGIHPDGIGIRFTALRLFIR
jgi:hypothetical protein